MSGSGRATTKRDRRRMTRREQYEQRRQERERERQRKLRMKRIQRNTLYGLGGLAAVVVIVLLSVFVFHIGSGSGSTTQHAKAVATFPPVSGAAASAQTIDGMTCAKSQGSAQNLHAYLEIYINGQQMTVPTGIGAPPSKNCTYPLVTPSGEPNVIHVMSASTSAYTLGQFFDVWGQPLSVTQVGTYKTNSSHKLVFEVFDANGKLTTITSDPRAITLVNHETLVILYNSPNVHPKAYSNWSSLKS